MNLSRIRFISSIYNSVLCWWCFQSERKPGLNTESIHSVDLSCKRNFLCGKEDVSKYKQNSCVNQIFDHLKACILTFLSFFPII